MKTKKEKVSRRVRTGVLELFRQNQALGRPSLMSDFCEKLGLVKGDLYSILDHHFKERKLEYLGSRILPFREGFRFPEEVRFILRKLLMNDERREDAAHELVLMMEQVIEERQAVFESMDLWGDNIPFIQPNSARFLGIYFDGVVKKNSKKSDKKVVRKSKKTKKKR